MGFYLYKTKISQPAIVDCLSWQIITRACLSFTTDHCWRLFIRPASPV